MSSQETASSSLDRRDMHQSDRPWRERCLSTDDGHYIQTSQPGHCVVTNWQQYQRDLLGLEWYKVATTSWQSLHPNRDQDQFFMPVELDMSGRMAVHKFLSRPWFSRAWVVQEVILAKHAVVRCGNREMDWETFSYFICDFRYAYLEDTWNGVLSRALFFDNELGRAYHRHYETVSGSRLMNLPFLIVAIRTARKRGRKLTMCELLKYARLQAATDSRDKVYSILGLLEDEELARLPKPDYTSHFLSVFSTWAKVSIVETGTLALLAAVEPFQNSPLLESWDLPSWVPDWRHTDRPYYDRPLMPVESFNVEDVSPFNASLYPRSPYAFNFLVHDRVLCARGIRLGTIPTLPAGHSMNFEIGDGAMLSLNKNLRSFLADYRRALIEADEFVREEFWRTISWDRASRSISKAVKTTRRINPAGIKLLRGATSHHLTRTTNLSYFRETEMTTLTKTSTKSASSTSLD